MQAFDRPLAAVGHGPLGLGEGEEVGALEVVEIGQAVQRSPLGLRQHGQASAVAGARRGIGLHGASVRWKEMGSFPIMRLYGKVSAPEVRRCLAMRPLVPVAPLLVFGKVGR